jgi:DNA adenine methylase
VPTSPIPDPGAGDSASASDSENEEALRPEPFLKWPGGKRWFVAAHPRLLRRRYGRYIEPFLGGGSVFFHLRPHQALLGDLNSDVITAYKGIRENYKDVELLLEKHHVEHCPEHYYQVRDKEPSTPSAQAARIIYLNRTCFNGIYRVNKLGQFNVPVGSRTHVVRSSDNFVAVAQLLSRAELLECDFEILTEKAEPDDLLFLDPPYTVRHNHNGFIKYNEQLFSWQDQERMAKAATRAAHQVEIELLSEDGKPVQLRVGPDTTGILQVMLVFNVGRPPGMLGDTDGGRALTVAVVTLEILMWLRPITGWNSSTGELTRWRRGRAR